MAPVSAAPLDPAPMAIAARFRSLSSSPRFPSRTVDSDVEAPSRVVLQARQDSLATIQAGYSGLDSGPSPGTVVGITLGSVGGFLIFLWLVYACVSLGHGGDGIGSYRTASGVTRQSRRRRSRRHHHRSPARRETIHVRRTRVDPVSAHRPAERIVVEETTHRARTPSPALPPPTLLVAAPAPRTVIEEGSVDEVVVIEEEDDGPPRGHRSRTRSHRRRSSSARRQSSRYRDVDPDRFGGRDTTPVREGRRSSRHGK